MTTKKSSKKQTGSTQKRPAKRKEGGEPAAPTVADVGAGAKKSAKVGQTPKGRKTAAPRKSLASAAVLVLAEAKEPMSARAIVDAAVAAGWYEPGKGKTPHATLYSSMLREACDDGDKARFRKAQRGMWELTAALGEEIG